MSDDTNPFDGNGEAGEPNPALQGLLRRPGTWEEPPGDLFDRISAEAVAGPPAATGPPVRDELARRRRAGRRRTILAAAAVALAVVGLAAVVLGGSDDEATTVDLAATELAPGVTGEAVVRDTPSGVEIRLDLDDLDPAPEGSYYQGWLKGPRGAVTIGTFHAREGSDGIVLWAGVDVDNYPTLTVTVQEEGAGAESSGKVVLTGAVGEE